jgi:serine/threonine protein kinase
VEGTTISHFRILAKIGEGGMGVVYKAEDEKLGRPVALKILPAGLTGDEERRLRLIREARTAAAVSHPNIAAVYEIDEVGGVTFVAMEYIDGKNLRAQLGGRPLEIKQALKIAAGIAEGLARAHQGRIVHRDLKPENVMMTADGHVKILDFGLAKLLEPHADATLSEMSRLETISAEQTREGTIVGTAAYMSPEQARGQTLDSRSDLFSFGIVLYEMITGKAPFKGSTRMDTLTAIIREMPLPAIDLNPDIPPELQRIVTKCLEKDPAERYQDTRDLAVDLKHLIRETDSQPQRRPEDSGVSVPAGRRIFQRVATMLAVGAIVVGAGLGWLAWQRSRTQRQTPAKPEITLRQLTANPAENYVYNAAISSDGKYLAYYDSETGVQLLSIETGEMRVLPIADADWGDELAWFPDGTRLALTKAPAPKESIWAYSVMTGIGRKLRDDACEPSVSPDGSLIAFRGGGEMPEIGIMQADGAAPRTIARAEKGKTVLLWNPVWSPNGRRVAWMARHLTEGGAMEDTIESADLEGNQPTVILSDPELSDLSTLWWLHDGRILFVEDASDPTTSKSVLWEMAVDPHSGRVEGPPRQVTSSMGSSWERLSASADGKRVALVDIPWQIDVYVGDLEANGTRLTEPRRLTHDDRDDYVSGWSRDSKFVLFVSPRGGTFDIFKQDLDSSTAELIFGSPEVDLNPQSMRRRCILGTHGGPSGARRRDASFVKDDMAGNSSCSSNWILSRAREAS